MSGTEKHDAFKPPDRIYVGQLTKATPTPFTPEDLRRQLDSIGLNCAQITEQTLQQYIDDVISRLSNGLTQVYGIMAPARDLQPGTKITDVSQLESAATGNWTIHSTAESFQK